MTATTAVTRAEFETLVERVEELEDALLLERAEAAAAERDYLPAALVERMLDGESPIRLWREHRGLSMETLAEAAGIDPAHLRTIETRSSGPVSAAVLRAIATALHVDPDDLVM